MSTDLPNWYDVRGLEVGQWARIKPALHCEGSGPPRTGRERKIYCNGGSGLWLTTRARWIRWDGVLQCGTCRKLDEAQR